MIRFFPCFRQCRSAKCSSASVFPVPVGAVSVYNPSGFTYVR